MTEKEFLVQLADAMQRDEALTPEMQLEELEEWDSLSVVSLLALYDNLFKIQLSGNTLKECKSVADLLALAKDRLESY